MPNARHSAATPRWGTPGHIVERARSVMGSLDLDPCSEARFQAVVNATQHYSLEDRGEDGLALPWQGRVFCNPPGRLVRDFWRKSVSEPIEQMIWVGFSVEQLCVLADEQLHPLDFTTCILRSRLDFERHDGYHGSPSHANYISGIEVDFEAFAREFGDLGRIIRGPLAR